MPVEIEFDPDVFHGELTANRAQVFVRVARTADLADCTLHGFVHGPRCEYAHTLPARFALQDLGAGPTLLARATLTDPCLWTSDLPQIYDVHVELRRGTEVLTREQRMLGLRGIGTRSGETPQLVREGKTWIPRGVALEALDTIDVPALRDQLLAGVCTSPPLDLFVEASRRGLYLIARLDAARQDVPTTLRSLARWPAVMAAVIRRGEALDRSLQQVAPNLLLVQEISAFEVPLSSMAPWAAAMLINLPTDQTTLPSGERNTSLPWFIQRPLLVEKVSSSEARAECDRLQRDLALSGQFSGYLVDVVPATTSSAGQPNAVSK
jgi:hypothetical protein